MSDKTINEKLKIIESFSKNLNSLPIEDIIKKQKNIFSVIEEVKVQFKNLNQKNYVEEFKKSLKNQSIELLLKELNEIEGKFDHLSIEDMHFYKEKALFIIQLVENKISSMKMEMETI